jgi:hypothetical protein
VSEKEEKRIALRVDPEQWQKWDDKRHAQRTTFQELGLRLFSEWFAGASPGTPLTSDNQPPTEPRVYNLHVVSRKSQKVLEIMGEIVSDLAAATGDPIVSTDQETQHPIAAHAAEAKDAVRRFDRNAKRLQEARESAQRRKRSGNTGSSGGAA